MYVTGIGKTKFGVLGKGIPGLAYEAILQAIEDSSLQITDINAIFVANFLGGPNANQLHLNALVASLLPGLNIPIIRIETACASGGSAIYQGLLALEKFDNVLVVGVEKMTSCDTFTNTKNIALAGDLELDQKEGLIFPGSYALVAQQYMLEYGIDSNDLDLISFKNHQNANLNPLAHFYSKKVTMEEIKNSPMICSPLKLFDCSPISDGAAAVVLSKKKYSKRSVKIIGSALATDCISLVQRESLTSFKSTKIAAQKAFDEAKVSPQDLDVLEVHDCFTIAEILAMEDLGICGPGEAASWIRAGKTRISGELPINPSGGLKACGHPIGATGVSQIYEITKQLRGEAGKYQVKGARVGLAHNVGGVGGTAVVHILRKE